MSPGRFRIPVVLVASALLLSLSPSAATPTLADTGYEMHAPILISNDSEFISENGVVRGSGSVSDPYVIEGWEVDATDANPTPDTQGAGILIRDTDAYFVIQNVKVRDGYPLNMGTWLWNCSNGNVRYSVVTNCDIGICLLSSTDCTAIGNDCTGQLTEAIAIAYSYDCVAVENNCSYNRGTGISARGGSGAVIANNSIWYNDGYGIETDPGDGYRVENNTVCHNGEGIQIETSNSVYRDNLVAFSDGTGLVFIGAWYNEVRRNVVLNNQGLAFDFHFGMEGYQGTMNRVCENLFIYNRHTDTEYDETNPQARALEESSWYCNEFSAGGRGNYWHDLTTPDNDSDGIVDIPYRLEGGDTAGAEDQFPLVSFAGVSPYVSFEVTGSEIEFGIRHYGIAIDGNDAFLNSSSGVVSGNGTTWAPYIIEGWDINLPCGELNASTAEYDCFGIRINDTDAYLVIRNVSFSFPAGTGETYDIWLSGVANVSIENCSMTPSSDHTGVYMADSSNITVRSCELDRGVCISARNASDGLVLGNRMVCARMGVSLVSVSGFRVVRNAFLGVPEVAFAVDDGGSENSWDGGYPYGGNYWEGHNSTDNCSGAEQQSIGSDGISDDEYIIDSDSVDRYPVVNSSLALNLSVVFTADATHDDGDESLVWILSLAAAASAVTLVAVVLWIRRQRARP